MSQSRKKFKANPADEDGLTSGTSRDGNEKFVLFYGKNTVFSNFYPSKFSVDGNEFNCGEQFFHYMKAVHFKDEPSQKALLASTDPGEQKRLGRLVENYIQQEWDDNCYQYMVQGLTAKFSQNEDMKNQLIATAPATIVEASPRDRKWGIGLGRTNAKALDRKEWRGKNLLGKALTEVRNSLMKTCEVKEKPKELDQASSSFAKE